MVRSLLESLVRVMDVLGAPFTYVSGHWMKLLRSAGVQRLPVSRAVFASVGVFPIRDHYYEPVFHPRHLHEPLDQPRRLPGIDLDIAGQQELLARFHWQDELRAFPQTTRDPLRFAWQNRSFGAGDGEILYSMIRHFRPRRIVEIGSGNSTLIARAAVKRNAEDDPYHLCEHTCIEPYEMPWLEQTGVRVLRERVEDIGLERFLTLEANDILFIDSSHMVRPQGDVLKEFLEILPVLQPGVLVHVHDIYTPRDYPAKRLRDEVRFWNEQYLLEALLSGSARLRVVAALHFLKHDHPGVLDACCPVLAAHPEAEPASFWMMVR
ncbi:MAG: class I SAM-dependent methyltransferase [Candidatus Eisenbacteria bacterium]